MGRSCSGGTRCLTLPSRGRVPAYGLHTPLMSNVRRHTGTRVALPCCKPRGGRSFAVRVRAWPTPAPRLRASASHLKLPLEPRSATATPCSGRSNSTEPLAVVPQPIGAPPRSVSSSLPPHPERIQCIVLQRQAIRCPPSSYTRCYIGSVPHFSVHRHLVTPNPSIEGTSYGLRPPVAPHVKR